MKNYGIRHTAEKASMTRDDLIGILMGTIAMTVSAIVCAACVVGMHAGTAEASQRDTLEASEQPFEPPSEPTAVDIQDAPAQEWTEPEPEPEPAWEEPAYVEATYVVPEVTYVAPELTYYEPAYAPTDGLTKEGGVNYHDGRTETYYSSNVLYHYRTPEWTLDEEGFYHDAEGRYVVAASDMEQGTVFEGSKGECVVLDCGCDAGVTDYYVNWI